MTQHQSRKADTESQNFPYRDTPAAELVELLEQRYETQGDFDDAVVWEIVGRFMVSEGLATDTGRWEGPYYVEEF